MGTSLALCTKSSSLSISTRTSIATFPSLAAQLFLQPCRDPLRDQSFDRSAEPGQLLDPARAEETVLGAGHEVERVDVGSLQAVELVHLELVLEVGDRAQALDDDLRPLLAREVDHERRERRRTHARQVGGRLL